MSDPDYASRLGAVATKLRHLHLALVRSQRRRYESRFGVIRGPGELLELLTGHPLFAWLRQLSQLMVAIDELREEPERLAPDAIATVRAAIEQLIGPGSHANATFRSRYLDSMQTDPSVALAHAEVKRALLTLPAASDASTDLHERHVRTMTHEHGRPSADADDEPPGDQS